MSRIIPTEDLGCTEKWKRSMRKLITSFGHAAAGIRHVVQTQKNVRIHLLVAAGALMLGWVVHLERCEWLVLLLTCALVLTAEGLNTAIEAAVDTATTTYHPMARVAKDVAAGSVLFCAAVAVLIGIILFGPHLWERIVPWLR